MLCLLAAVLTPLAYIAIGALAAFGAAFSLILLPPLLLACAWLLYQLCFAPPSSAVLHWRTLLTLVAIAILAGFCYLISGFTLFSWWERMAFFATMYSSAMLLALPILWFRCRHWQNANGLLRTRLALWASAAITALAAGGALVYLLVPAAPT